LEMGFSYTDLSDVADASDAMALMPHEWLRKGVFHEGIARQAERQGHKLTAAESYHRAAVAFGRARWGLRPGTPEMRSAYAHLTECYDSACRLLPSSHGSVRRLDADLGDGVRMPGILHTPPVLTGEERWPVAVVYPGMDMAKEYYPHF